MRGIRAWNRFWFARDTGHALAAFRMALGVYLLGYFLRWCRHVTLMFSSAGVYQPHFIGDIAPPPWGAWMIYGATLAAIVAWIAGVVTRVTTPLVLLLFLYHHLLYFRVTGSASESVVLLSLAVLSFTDVDRVWSVTARMRRPEASHRQVSIWAMQLLRLHVTLFYFGCGLWKALSAAWHEPRILRDLFSGTWGSPVAFWFVQLPLGDHVHLALAWGIMAAEMLLGLGLWWRRTRWLAALLGLGFHLSVALFMGIAEFLVCPTLYLLFWDPAEWRQFGARWRAGPRRTGATGAAVRM